MNINDIATQLLYTTVPIWVEHINGSKSSATSFIINKQTKLGTIPFLVTNKHVVQYAKNIIIRMARTEEGLPCKESKGINIGLTIDDFRSYDNFDIAAIPLGHIINTLNSQGTSLFYKGLAEDIFLNKEKASTLSAIENIIFIGYPSGLYDSENLCPIIRQGITASPIWNNFQNQPKFIIDAGVFPGSSGSPVFIFNQGTYSSGNNIVVGSRLILLGILTETIQKKETETFNVYLNLGNVIKCEILDLFLSSLVNEIENNHSLQAM